MLQKNTWSKVYRTSSNIGKKQNVNYEQTLKLFINASLISMEGASKTLEDFTVQFIFFLFLDGRVGWGGGVGGENFTPSQKNFFACHNKSHEKS